VFIKDGILRIHNTGVAPKTVKRAVMGQRRAVEELNGWGITWLEVSQHGRLFRSYPIK
jgi:hypothetical protein